MAGVRDNTVSNVASGGIASFKSVGQIPLKSLKVNFNPIQEGDGDPSPSNVRAISGWTGLNVFHSESKNILDPFNNPIWNHNVYSVNQSGEITVTGSDGRGWTGTQISPLNLVKGTYTISYTGGGNCNLRTSIDDYETNYNTTNGHLTFTLTEDAGIKFKFSGKTYPATFYVQIEPGQTTHDYESYKPFATVPVSWSNLGTIYGGYVDLIKGKLVEKYGVADIDSFDYSLNTVLVGVDRYIAQKPSNCKNIGNSQSCPNQVSDIYGVEAIYEANDNYSTWITTVFNGQILFYVPANTYSSIEDFKTAMSGHKIYYELATPIEYDIDPITIKSLIGQNNIWSNADIVEAQYCALESLDIYKQRFKTNEPHLQSASGNIASFQTDMVAPLKECKVYFQPVQASGTPSPNNVLPISGWNNIILNQAGKNLFDINTLAVPNEITINNGVATGSMRNFYTNFYVNGEMFEWGKNERLYLSVKAYRDSPQADDYAGMTFYGKLLKDGIFTLARFSNDTGTPTTLGGATYNSDLTKSIGIAYASQPNAIWHVSDIQIELGTTGTEYESYNGSTTSITLPSTYYGGYCNPITGQGVITWYMRKLDSSTPRSDFTTTIDSQIGVWGYRTDDRGSAYQAGIASQNPSTQLFCDKMVVNTVRGVTDATGADYVIKTRQGTVDLTNRNRIYFTWTGMPTDRTQYLDELLNNIQPTLAWNLETPISFSFTPINSIKTLYDTNNIWSNTNGITQVKYWTHIPKGGTLPWHPVEKFSKVGLIQVSATGHTLYENAYTTLNGDNPSFKFLSMGAQSGGNYYPAIGLSGREEFFDIFPYPIPRGAKTITVNCGSNFAPIIVYYDKNTKANVANLARDCAKVLDGETPAGNTDWSISAWEYGDKTFTIPTGLGINAFTLGFNCKTSDIYNNFDINNSGISISFGYN